MIKVEAPTLEDAYKKASKILDCSISELEYEIMQYPSKGILGLLKKNAIIVAISKKIEKESIIEVEDIVSPTIKEESVASEIIDTIKEEAIVVEDLEVSTPIEKDIILENFFEVEKEKDFPIEDENIEEEVNVVYDELALLIENQLKELLDKSCFDIDVVEVDVIDNRALIFIDGEDAALLIGKEGYRYNALSYMIFNWLHSKYELFIKLEIAEFLTTQQDMIANYIQPVIENVEKYGKGKTRFLDGILVQIALEQLRERFPDKYVAVKTGREGKKFVVINNFNSSPKNKN